jgi:outer membrane lipopolysaccharide assembly protein LptE/RlpB
MRQSTRAPALARARAALRRAAWACVCACLLAGCGYGLRPGRLREGLERVAVPYFENESTEPELEVLLTEQIISGLIGDRTLQVVDEPQADAVVLGRIRRYESDEAHFGADRQAEEYEVRIVVEVTLTDRASGEPIAGPKDLRGTASYRIEDGEVGEQAAREQAARQIVDGILNLVIEEW